MIPQYPTLYLNDSQTYFQPSNNSFGRKLKQQSNQQYFIVDTKIMDCEHQRPKSFDEIKRKIKSQLNQTIGCLNQKNKQNLLNSLDKSQLLDKDSEIFMENYQTFKKQDNQKPQQIEKYLSFQTGAQYSSQQRKQMY